MIGMDLSLHQRIFKKNKGENQKFKIITRKIHAPRRHSSWSLFNVKIENFCLIVCFWGLGRLLELQ